MLRFPIEGFCSLFPVPGSPFPVPFSPLPLFPFPIPAYGSYPLCARNSVALLTSMIAFRASRLSDVRA